MRRLWSGLFGLFLTCSGWSQPLPWRRDVPAAMAESRISGKPVLVMFYVDYIPSPLNELDASKLEAGVRPELDNIVLVQANLLAYPEWRHNPIFTLPYEVFVNSDGLILCQSDQGLSAEAFADFSRQRNRLEELTVKAASQQATYQDWRALGLWHAEHLNRSHAITALREAALRTEGKNALEILLDVAGQCSDRLCHFRDEKTANWALERIQLLDPDNGSGYLSLAAIRRIELNLESGRLAEGIQAARNFLSAQPRDLQSGEALIRLVWALQELGDFASALEVLENRAGIQVTEEQEKELQDAIPSVYGLGELRRAADEDPTSFVACWRYLVAIHDDPPRGHWEHYLRRALLAPDAKPKGRVDATANLVAIVNREEALHLICELLADPRITEDERKRCEKLRDNLK